MLEYCFNYKSNRKIIVTISYSEEVFRFPTETGNLENEIVTEKTWNMKN